MVEQQCVVNGSNPLQIKHVGRALLILCKGGILPLFSGGILKPGKKLSIAMFSSVAESSRDMLNVSVMVYGFLCWAYFEGFPCSLFLVGLSFGFLLVFVKLLFYIQLVAALLPSLSFTACFLCFLFSSILAYSRPTLCLIKPCLWCITSFCRKVVKLSFFFYCCVPYR